MNQAANDGEYGNVYYMADAIKIKLNALCKRRDDAKERAKQLSKKKDPKDDPFAAPFITRAEEAQEKIVDLYHHLQFIERGGHGVQIDPRGYLLQQPYVAPPVVIQVSLPAPTK